MFDPKILISPLQCAVNEIAKGVRNLLLTDSNYIVKNIKADSFMFDTAALVDNIDNKSTVTRANRVIRYNRDELEELISTVCQVDVVNGMKRYVLHGDENQSGLVNIPALVDLLNKQNSYVTISDFKYDVHTTTNGEVTLISATDDSVNIVGKLNYELHWDGENVPL